MPDTIRRAIADLIHLGEQLGERDKERICEIIQKLQDCDESDEEFYTNKENP